MTNINSLEELADLLKDQGPHNPDIRIETVGDVVTALLDVAAAPEVYDAHDDHLSLQSDLPTDLLELLIEDADGEQFEEHRAQILEQANIILPLAGYTDQ